MSWADYWSYRLKDLTITGCALGLFVLLALFTLAIANVAKAIRESRKK